MDYDNGWCASRLRPRPFAFLIYINDITHVIRHCQIRLFAADTSLFIEVDNRERAAKLIKKDLNELSQWAKTWLVKFSPPTTESLIIISNKAHLEKHPPPPFKYGG